MVIREAVIVIYHQPFLPGNLPLLLNESPRSGLSTHPFLYTCDDQSIPSAWMDLGSPQRHTSGCIDSVVSRKIQLSGKTHPEYEGNGPV